MDLKHSSFQMNYNPEQYSRESRQIWIFFVLWFFPLLPYIIILLLCLWNYCFMLYLSACLLYDKLNNHHIKITSNYMHLLFYGTKEMSINGFQSTCAFIVAHIFLSINHYMWAITPLSCNHYNYIGVKQLSLRNACVISNCGGAHL